MSLGEFESIHEEHENNLRNETAGYDSKLKKSLLYKLTYNKSKKYSIIRDRDRGGVQKKIIIMMLRGPGWSAEGRVKN